MFDDLLPHTDAATFIGVSQRTLARQRAYREGIPFIRVGRKVFYRRSSIERWLTANEVHPVVPANDNRKTWEN